MDPIADQFPWVSVFNYAENEPVGHIDLWGLQKVIFDLNARNNSTFLSGEAINRQTTGGKRFMKALLGQSKIDIVYSILSRGASGFTDGPFKSFTEFKEARAKRYSLYYSTENTWEDYEDYFEKGKELVIIGINCPESCSDEDIREAAATVNHEELAHALNKLKGVIKTISKEHEEYQNQTGQLSPSTDEIKTKDKYKNTEAKKQIDEIDKIMRYEE